MENGQKSWLPTPHSNRHSLRHLPCNLASARREHALALSFPWFREVPGDRPFSAFEPEHVVNWQRDGAQYVAIRHQWRRSRRLTMAPRNPLGQSLDAHAGASPLH